MDSFELNKIAGAVLMALLVVMGVGVMSDIIFTPHHPEQPGFVIAVATEGEGEAAGGEQAQVAPIGARLASATVEAGEKAARKCAACHDFTKGGPNKVGPNLWDVVGRKPGAHEGFKYSASMTEFGAEHDAWTYEELDHFLADPKGYVKGTTMGFAGLKKPEERADMIAYLHSLSDSPLPLPPAETDAAQSE